MAAGIADPPWGYGLSKGRLSSTRTPTLAYPTRNPSRVSKPLTITNVVGIADFLRKGNVSFRGIATHLNGRVQASGQKFNKYTIGILKFKNCTVPLEIPEKHLK